MRILSLFTSAFILTAPLRAQDKIAGAFIDEKKISDLRGTKVGEYIVTTGQTTLEGSFVLLLHPDQGLVRRVNLSRHDLQLRGVASQEDAFTMFLSSSVLGGTEKVEQLTFSKTSRTLSAAKEVASIAFSDKLVGGFTDQQDFWLVTAQKKNRTLTLKRFNGAGLASENAFTVPDEKLFRVLLKKDVAFIAAGQETPFEQAKELNKAYWREGKLTFAFDDQDGPEASAEVALLTFDTQTGTSAVRRLALGVEPKTRHNSFLHGDTLFVLSVNRQALQLSVFSTGDSECLRRFSYPRGEVIEIKASPLFKNGENAERDWSVPGNPRKVFKSISSAWGRPVISVWGAGNAYRFLLGEYAVARGGGGGMMIPTGGGTFSTPGGSFTVPVTYGFSHVGGGSSAAVYTYFYGALLKQQLRIAPAETAVSGVFDQIQARIKLLDEKIKLGGQGLITSPDGTYLLYLNGKEKYLTVEAFTVAQPTEVSDHFE